MFGRGVRRRPLPSWKSTTPNGRSISQAIDYRPIRLDAVEANEAAIRTSAGSGPLLLEMPVYRLSGAAR